MKTINIAVEFGLLGMVLIMLSCNPEKRWEKEEVTLIQKYVGSLGDTLCEYKPSGLYYIELSKGSGRIPVANDTVHVRYEAKYLDGYIFTSNLNDSTDVVFVVGSGQVIKGIDEGVKYMKEGGTARLLTPSYLMYGSSGLYGYLPGYTPLTWNISLLRVRPGVKK